MIAQTSRRRRTRPVSMTSCEVAPRCRYWACPGASIAARMASTSAGTGTPASRVPGATAAGSRSMFCAAWRIASALAGGIRPSSPCACASAASTRIMPRSSASSLNNAAVSASLSSSRYMPESNGDAATAQARHCPRAARLERRSMYSIRCIFFTCRKKRFRRGPASECRSDKPRRIRNWPAGSQHVDDARFGPGSDRRRWPRFRRRNKAAYAARY